MRRLAIGLAAVLVLSSPASAQEKFIFAGNPVRNNLTDYFDQVGKKVAADSGGELEFDVRYGLQLANFNNIVDRIDSDVVQMGQVITGIYGDKFALTETMALPFVVEDPVAGSAALWRLYKTGALDSEFTDLVPVMLCYAGINTVHFSRPLTDPVDFKGLKIRVGTRAQSEAVEVFGGTPLVFQLPDVYEILLRRTVDGAVAPWTAFDVYKFNEVTSYHVDIPFGATTLAVLLSRKRYDGLSARARKALDDDARQEANSRQCSAELAKQGDAPRALAESQPDKHKIVKLSAEQEAIWKGRVNAVVLKEWFEKFPATRKVLADFSKIYADVKAGR